MTWMSTMKTRLRALERPARFAVVAESALRVLPVYENEQIGNPSDAVTRAIELAWARALGQQIARATIDSCLAELQELIDYYFDADFHPAADAIAAAQHALQTTNVADDMESSAEAARGLMAARQAASQAEARVAKKAPGAVQKGDAMAREDAWQSAALAIADAWKGDADRDMFAPAGPKPPSWLTQYLGTLPPRP